MRCSLMLQMPPRPARPWASNRTSTSDWPLVLRVMAAPAGRYGDRRANALARETIRDEELSQLAGVALFRTGLTLETDVTGALNLAAHPAPPEEGYQWQQK